MNNNTSCSTWHLRWLRCQPGGPVPWLKPPHVQFLPPHRLQQIIQQDPLVWRRSPQTEPQNPVQAGSVHGRVPIHNPIKKCVRSADPPFSDRLPQRRKAVGEEPRPTLMVERHVERRISTPKMQGNAAQSWESRLSSRLLRSGTTASFCHLFPKKT